MRRMFEHVNNLSFQCWLFSFQGQVCGDTCAMCFCPCCAIIQMYNELEFQGL